jgi:hypothetical protein
VNDSYDHVLGLLPRLTSMPRTIVTQTVAPSTAARADLNFEHLLDLGFRRFNFLPGYYLPWRPEQLAALSASFSAIAARIVARWRQDQSLYVRNLFTWAPTPFFNTGLVVDSDASIHPTNLGLSAALDELRADTCVGTLDDPPTPEALAAKAREINTLLERALPSEVWSSTLAVDAELSAFCRGLYPDWAAYRRRRRSAA